MHEGQDQITKKRYQLSKYRLDAIDSLVNEGMVPESYKTALLAEQSRELVSYVYQALHTWRFNEIGHALKRIPVEHLGAVRYLIYKLAASFPKACSRS
ncbi:hypothetical protein SV7mr_34310 [Stieleria bergensis]|uniref:Uncharacterized protein n=2 Tax=Stieleria bergensis TaxID=2528025 RepID=A0A517SXU2_9BACT|nr:hypothetical protein SV7mr_34310 [Planctomycetes bacterium SV_7m_r]